METLYVIYYVVLSLGLLGNLYVTSSLLKLGSQKSCFTFLLLCFHVSLLGETFTAIPHLYNYSDGLCVANQFFHFYFSLMNIVVLLFLVESHRSSLLEDFFLSRQLILKYGLYFIAFFPLITILPFSNGGYSRSEEDDNAGWCILSFSHDTTWELSIFFIWVWLIMIMIFCMMGFLQYRLCRTDQMIAKSLFSSVGSYVIVGIASWLPRSFERMASKGHNPSLAVLFISYLPVTISGILYTLIFINERRSLEKYSEFPDEVGDLSFTWEKSEILDLIRNSHAGENGTKTSFASVTGLSLWRNSNAMRPSSSSISAPPISRNTISHIPNPILRNTISAASAASHITNLSIASPSKGEVIEHELVSYPVSNTTHAPPV